MRRVDGLGVPPEKIESSVTAVETAFGLVWLSTADGAHKLQRLWQRDDALATTELVTLGDAIDLLVAVDGAWVRERIQTAKANSANSHGYLFELLAIAMLVRTGTRVCPTRGNFPAVDAVISFDDGFEVRLSIKNHDLSEHERFFRDRSRKTRKHIHKSLSARHRAIQVMIEAQGCLTEPEWQQVENALKAVTATVIQPYVSEVISKKVVVGLRPLLSRPGALGFASNYLSDTFLAISAQHKYEQKGFVDKVYKAAANLRKHASRSDRTANVVFMRLHPSASLKALQAYAQEILDEEGSDPGVDGIVLYQPSVVRRDGQSLVTHHMCLAASLRWPLAAHPLHFATLIGAVSSEASRNELQISNGGKLDLSGRYIFQAGDHFYAARLDAGQIDISSVAPGILVHAVFETPAPGMVIRGKFPDDEELAII